MEIPAAAEFHGLAVHDRAQVVCSRLIQTCALDFRQLANNFHSAVHASTRFRIVAGDRIAFTIAADNEFICRQTLNVDEIIERRHGPSFREFLIACIRPDRVSVAVNLHDFVRMHAHDVRRFAEQVACLIGQHIGAGHECTTAEFERDSGIAVNTEHAATACRAQVGYFYLQLIEVHKSRLHDFLNFGNVVPDDFIGQQTVTPDSLHDAVAVTPDLEHPGIDCPAGNRAIQRKVERLDPADLCEVQDRRAVDIKERNTDAGER